MCSSVRILPQISNKPANSRLRQVGQRVRTLDEFSQALSHRRTLEQLTKYLNLAPQLVERNRLDEFFRSGRRLAIKLLQLRCRGTRNPQSISFGDHLADQPHRLRLGSVDTAARKQQIAEHRVAQVAPQSRNPAKARNQPKPKLGKTKPCRLVSDDQIANQRQFKSAAERDALNCRECGH